MFSQRRPALEGSRGGLGIGLALARGIVSLHSGSLTAHSDGPGQGSLFAMQLPLTTEPISTDSGGSSDAEWPAPSPSCRILVADDNADGLETLDKLMTVCLRSKPALTIT